MWYENNQRGSEIFCQISCNVRVDLEFLVQRTIIFYRLYGSLSYRHVFLLRKRALFHFQLRVACQGTLLFAQQAKSVGIIRTDIVPLVLIDMGINIFVLTKWLQSLALNLILPSLNRQTFCNQVLFYLDITHLLTSNYLVHILLLG